MVLAVIVSDAPPPSPAILNDTLRLPLGFTLELQLMKCAFWASTVIAMKPRAIMVQMRILNFFIWLFLMIFCWFFRLSLAPPIKKMGEIFIITFWWRDFPGHTVTFSGVCWYHRSRKASANCFKTSGKLKVAAVRCASFRCGEIRILDLSGGSCLPPLVNPRQNHQAPWISL